MVGYFRLQTADKGWPSLQGQAGIWEHRGVQYRKCSGCPGACGYKWNRTCWTTCYQCKLSLPTGQQPAPRTFRPRSPLPAQLHEWWPQPGDGGNSKKKQGKGKSDGSDNLGSIVQSLAHVVEEGGVVALQPVLDQVRAVHTQRQKEHVSGLALPTRMQRVEKDISQHQKRLAAAEKAVEEKLLAIKQAQEELALAQDAVAREKVLLAKAQADKTELLAEEIKQSGPETLLQESPNVAIGTSLLERLHALPAQYKSHAHFQEAIDKAQEALAQSLQADSTLKALSGLCGVAEENAKALGATAEATAQGEATQAGDASMSDAAGPAAEPQSEHIKRYLDCVIAGGVPDAKVTELFNAEMAKRRRTSS